MDVRGSRRLVLGSNRTGAVRATAIQDDHVMPAVIKRMAIGVPIHPRVNFGLEAYVAPKAPKTCATAPPRPGLSYRCLPTLRPGL